MRHHLKLADASTCVLIRHADAGEADAWAGPDDFRPLSPLGWSQAADVVDALRRLGLRWLLSSPSLRCRQTLVPLAEAVDLDIQPHVDLSLRGSRDELVELMTSPEESGLVLCSHGEVIEEVLDRLPSAPRAGLRPATAEGGFWLLRGQGTSRTARYCAPPRSEPVLVLPDLAAGGLR